MFLRSSPRVTTMASSDIEGKLDAVNNRPVQRAVVGREGLSENVNAAFGPRPQPYPVDQRQAACWQSQRSSILSPACLQWSLQYLPWGPWGGTRH
jgi:hypothetical protein